MSRAKPRCSDGVGLADHAGPAGAIQLIRETGKHGVGPVVGCEVYGADDRMAPIAGYAHRTVLPSGGEPAAHLA